MRQKDYNPFAFKFFFGGLRMIKGIKGFNITKNIRTNCNELFIVNRICNEIVQDLVIDEIDN